MTSTFRRSLGRAAYTAYTFESPSATTEVLTKVSAFLRLCSEGEKRGRGGGGGERDECCATQTQYNRPPSRFPPSLHLHVCVSLSSLFSLHPASLCATSDCHGRHVQYVARTSEGMPPGRLHHPDACSITTGLHTRAPLVTSGERLARLRRSTARAPRPGPGRGTLSNAQTRSCTPSPRVPEPG